ncbi:Nonribosomal peptide synthetase 2 [Cytospora mali]|uniref:Nonribosomal peptide synthetase 2 n=1 Tax=Cytospora mali TaxID=578113 RepID=A0A194URC5_CYTMA|nr:Nonribosomal peptide synthetase 2 [Valsa mali var. pyri (nom. inval.)]
MASTTPQPPITELRPLHCLQHEASRQEASALATELPHWQSFLSPRPDEETCIKAFVKLVSRVVVLEHGEAYCIQQHNSSRGRGFILAHAGQNDFSFIDHHDAADVPNVRLSAPPRLVPAAALEALGCMLDDLILALQRGEDQSDGRQWTQPSVLNYPPRSRPVPLLTSQDRAEDQNEQALLHRWFEKRVDEQPDRIALDFLVDLESGERSQFTYRQLDNAANALARELVRAQGAHAASDAASGIKTIAVMMGPCPELYTSYLATLKAGMAFCPIPVDAPAERLDALMADLKPTAVFVAASSPASSGSITGTMPLISVSSYLGACDEEVERQGEESRSSVTENDVAYVLYTSGTTGMPKGVAVSHLSATCTVSALSAHYGYVPTEVEPTSPRKPTRWFQGAAPTFDISLFEIFWTLSTGSTLCCAPRHLTLQDINKVVTTLRADITNITPSFATLLEPSSIRGLMLGGETLNARVVHDFAQHNPAPHDNDVSGPRGLYNGYGPTETAIYCIAQSHVPEGQRGSVLGSPLKTCGVLIVDEACTSTIQPVPMAATGELLITGPQVSRIGYLNRPDETSRAFINDDDAAGWGRAYRTGDRARIIWDESGKPVIEFLGRISDDQVKLSGRRVELGEIESVLMYKVEGVRETISCVWKPENSQPGSERVVNLVITTPGSSFEAEVLERCKEAAQRHLPDYMRPFKIIHVESLPRTASGKVDRKAASAYVRGILKDQQPKLLTRETTEDVKPLAGEDAELEEQLLSIVADILGGNAISAATPLADAGVDSLRAMRLLREIRRRWPDSSGRHLQPSLALLLDTQATVRSVFFPTSSQKDLSDKADGTKEDRTRARLAEFSSKHLSDVRDKLDVASEADIELILPATTQQSQLAISFAMDRTRYISHSVLRLKPNVSAAALKRAVEEVILEQAIYRSAMLPCDDSLSPFAQVILTPEAWRRPKSNVGEAPQVVHRKTGEQLSVDAAHVWVALAEENISLESQRLYHIQVVENETNPDSDGLLIISIAHCICDGASVEVLMCDIARRYAGLESLQRQSIYDAVLECFSNVGPETDGLWRESLKGWELEPFGALSGNNVHSKKSSKSASDCGVVQYKSDLPWQVLEDKSRTLGGGASPLAILQAAWSLLLHMFSEADTGDITFGSVISGHLSTTTHAPTFSVVPCRVPLPETQSISQLVDSLTKHGKFALGHRHLSWGVFETLPYNTALALQAYPVEDGGLEDNDSQIPWTEVRHPVMRYDFPIFVEVFPNDPSSPNRSQFSNMTFKVTYREDALSELSANCVVKQLAALTQIILSCSPDDAISGLPARLPRSLLSAEGTVPPANSAGTNGQDNHLELLHGQFEAQAIETPSRLALTFYDALDSSPTSLSYAELDSLANGVAHLLREEDVDVIPLCIERSVDLYVAILAVLKAGSAWCPIDLTSPVARRTSLIARTKSKVLLTNTESWHLVQPCIDSESLKGMRVILIDQHSNPSSVKPKPRQGIKSGALGGEDLAYLLWTSGTTGEPKGVMIQHSAAAQAMQDLQVQVEHDPKTEQVRTLQLSAYSFDVFVQDLFYTWGLSGSVISGTRELVLGSFVEFIWKARPTHAHLTPSFGASIAVEEIRGSPLQYVTFIGEKLTEDVAEAWAAPGITTRAYNTYGPAENAVVSTMRRFFGKSRDQAKAANVGFPLNPCTAYVVHEVPIPGSDERRWELVPRYGVGELALGGSQVAKGYLSDPAKTASRFIQGGPGIDERIYLTGDMVRLNDHGFEFLGRNDDLVKITGIRIELSEISAACASIKDEDDAIEHVETLHLPRPDRENADHKVVVTFVSVKKDGVDQDAIRTQVFKRAREMLPTYMVPGHIVVLNTTMPRTASNKVDRKELQAIYKSSNLQALAGGGSAGDTSGQSAEKQQWTDEQLHVLQILADNFKVAVEPLSPDDSLAALGLSSLQVTKLAWSLRRQLSVQVGVLELMRCELLGELVDVVLSKQTQGSQKQTSIRKTSNGASPEKRAEKSWLAVTRDLLTTNLRGDMLPPNSFLLPATPMQESLIFETMREPKAYWAHRVFDLSHLDTLQGDRLKAAWTAAASTFDILRTSFVPLAQLDAFVGDEGQSTNGISWARRQGLQSTILQVVRKEAAVRWKWLSSDEDQNLARWAQEPGLTELSPMLPPWVVTIAEKDRKMMLSVHHSLYDYDSSETVLNAVTKFYHQNTAVLDDVVQFERGMELGLLPTTAQRNEATSFWTERLAGLRETAGALNAPFPDLTQSRQKQVQRIIGAKKAVPGFLSSDLPTALPTLLQSAFGCVLASYLEIKAIVFGQTVSQRLLHPDLAHVVGPAIATLPLAVRADAHSAEELWVEMARDSSNLFRVTHHLHPVDIKRLLNEGTGSGDAPFAAVFVYHPASSGDDDGAGAVAEQPVFREVEQALSLNVEHPLAFNVFEGEEMMELTGDSRRISQAQLELMLDQIIDQARVMKQYPQLPLGQLQNRLDRRLVSLSGEVEEITTGAGFDPTESVAQHASQHPDWIAAEEVLTSDDADDDDDAIATKTITYSQLDKLTNAIASQLASHEVGLHQDDVVALYLGRDIKSLAATLAIFRAGYIYLPVDEDLPLARKQLLIRDAAAKLVITTEELAKDLDMDHDDPPALLLPESDDALDLILEQQQEELSQSRPSSDHGHGGYLLYTSGSTGRPKGVRVSNRNLCHFISSFSLRMTETSSPEGEPEQLGGSGKYLNLTSRAFDPHLTQLFVPWHLGYRVVIGNRTALLGNLQHAINHLGITHFGSVPSVLTQLRLQPEDVPSVRVVTTGGEKASNELLDTWTTQEFGQSQDGPTAKLINFYGPTEVTIGCLGHIVNRNSNARNLGLPFKGLEALLLAPSGENGEQVIVRRGQPGELCIAGPQVALGYLERPVENAKSFQTTSLMGDSDTRIYRTGDVMRMMHDGSLEFLGRADQQAKIRGQRLELDEVVSFLKEQATDEGELDFAAAVVTGEGNQQQLFGFVARKAHLRSEMDAEVELLQSQGQALTSLLERLGQKCEAKLPAFMVPKLLWVSRIPYLAASGKVDTKLLAKLANDFFASQNAADAEDSDDSGVDVAPSTLSSGESLVVAAVEEAVGHKINGKATSSIRLGIDSLSAVHLVALLRKRGYSKVNVSDILSSSATVASIAQLADQHRPQYNELGGTPKQSTSGSDRLKEFKALSLSTVFPGQLPAGLVHDDVEAVLPCLPLQAALVARSIVWMSAHDDDSAQSSESTVVPYVAQFNYRLSSGTNLVRWQRAAERVVASEAMLRACFVQREDDGKVFQIVLRSPSSTPFDTEGEEPADIVSKMGERPPIRIQLREEGGEAFVSLRIHHALFDGVAIAVLLKRVEQAYDQGLKEDIVVSANKSLDVLTRISANCDLSASQLDSTKALWQDKLRGVRPCHLGSIDDSKGTVRSARYLPWTLPQIRDKLNSQHAAVSASSVFQVATALCLSQLTKQTTSVVYGFVMSLRPLLDHVVDSGVEEFLGPCLNTLVQAFSLRKDESLLEFSQRVHQTHVETCQGTMPLVSVEQVQRWAGSEYKLFDSLLSINVLPSADASEPRPGRMSVLQTQSRSDMALAFDVDLHHDGKITLTLSSAGVLNESGLDEVGQLFEKVVGACISVDREVRVRDLLPVDVDATVAANGVDDGGIASRVDGGQSDSDAGFEVALASVQTILCRLLRLSPSDINKDRTTSLYQIGLDSITVLPFVRHLNKSEKVKLTPDAVLKARTIYGTARLLQQARTNANINTRRQEQDATDESDNDETKYDRTLGRLAKDLMFVATPLQEGMLSASLATSGRAYTYDHTVQLSEEALQADTPNLDHFFAAVKDTVQACEILRTRFIFTQDDEAPWVGIVSPTEQSDLANWTALSGGRIQLRISHVLYDATSIQTIWRILGENYNRRLSGGQVTSPETEAQRHEFRPFAKAVATMQRTSVGFWANLLQGYKYTPLEFSEDLSVTSAFHFNVAEQGLSLLQTRCKAAGVTTKTVLMLAWAKVLSEFLFGQPDVVYGQVVSSRHEVETVVGPTINTVPMRVTLDKGASVAEGLAQVQRLSDEALGANAMASLRKVQTLWRSSAGGRDEDLPVSLFQSLFVFDGVVGHNPEAGDSQSLFRPVHEQIDNGEERATYDDYYLIASFRIQNNTLCGKLRARLVQEEVDALGSHLEAAVRSLITDDFQKPALDFGRMEITKKSITAANTKGTANQPEFHAPTAKADSVLAIVKSVLGKRWQSKEISYNTKLINVGLDSILAIRLSTLLRKRMRMTVSVFQIMKGASVLDIVVANSTQASRDERQHEGENKTIEPATRPRAFTLRQQAKLLSVAAERLELSEDLVQSVLPVLPGQRSHLEQWLYNGRRFFEAPWVYRVGDSLDKQTIESCWTQLRRLHDVLRTTFLHTDVLDAGLVQVTMSEQWSASGGFTTLQDSTKPIQILVEDYVRRSNNKPSDLTQPPAYLTLLEGSDGKAVVLRLHHALYDAWSIKMIAKDLDELLAGVNPQGRTQLSEVVRQIMAIREPTAEDAYWKDHLAHAQDTVLDVQADPKSTLEVKSPLGPHFQVKCADVIPQATIDKLSRTNGKAGISAAIILAYARTLRNLTRRSRPTFGVNHAARSLSSADEAQALDLTDANAPTMTTTPFCLDLDGVSTGSTPPSDEDLIGFVQDHLAQLTKFAQSDGAQKFCPRFNAHINILYPGDDAGGEGEKAGDSGLKVLQRHRLDERLASEYFTVTQPSTSAASMIQGLETDHLSPHRFFFNVIVREGISVAASGDEALFGGDREMVTRVVDDFAAELTRILEHA